MKKHIVLSLLLAAAASGSRAQTEVRTEAQATIGDGPHTPLWLQANKYGLSSLDDNGYLRAGIFKTAKVTDDSDWRWGYAADLAVATGFTSTLVVQQAYGEVGWKKGLLTIGSKEQPAMLKNQELSSGAQTLGVNARPVPSIRIELPDYWRVPGTNGWLSLKGHISYGMATDDRWQKDFTHQENRYAEHTKLHTKAGYLKIGKEEKPVSVELGLEMACQYGGTAYTKSLTATMNRLENTDGLKGALRAFVPGGNETTDEDYHNADGNHLGSMLVRVNMEQAAWGLSVYADHFFEDQSQMFLLDYDGYGKGADWDKHEKNRMMLYDLRDMLVGMELRLKGCPWLTAVVAEYLYTKYQSGPVYHDHTRQLSDHIGGVDDYYNHNVFTGWQHWGQVMGNPLYRSPLYNDNNEVMVGDNRFWAWHIAASGDPLPGLHYRLMCSWQRGFGTYKIPFNDPKRNISLLAEAAYSFGQSTALAGWSVKCGVGLDKGSRLGDNIGAQFTVGKRLFIK